MRKKTLSFIFQDRCAKESIKDFAEERKYNEKVLKELKIGKCTMNVMSELMQDIGKEKLIETGLIRDGKFVFINRIIIPYNIDYFEGRSTSKSAKLKNLFLKGKKKQLYFVKGKEDVCYVYEGSTSLIAGKHIYPNANHCSIGGVTSYYLLDELNKHYKGKKLIFCFDNDDAGIKCSKNAGAKLSGKGYNISSLKFDPKWNDIDDLWREHQEKAKDFITEEKLDISIVDLFDEKCEKNNTNSQEGVTEGERNVSCYKLAMQHRNKGNSKEDTLKLLTEWNSKNDPPLPEEEVERVVTSAYNRKSIGLPYGFIFDEDKIIITKTFSFFENGEKAGIGILNPKTIEIHDKKGNLIGYEQKDLPLIIFSDGSSKPYSARFREEERIKFEAIPYSSERRWSLSSIKKYLQGEYGKIDGMKLFHKIKDKYKKFMFYSNEWWYDIHTLWDMGTYFFLLFKAYPLIELRGVRGSAKTKTMNISSFISFNATEIMTNPSESTLFRETHERRPTKYIDEAEKLFQIVKGKVESDPRVEVINSSYHYKGTVPRQERFGSSFKTMWYKTYSPTMVASINGLYGATEDRAIVHISIKSPKNDKRGEEEPEEDKTFKEIRDELYIFTLQNWKEIKDIYYNLENETKLRNRDYQLWKPLLSIAKFLDPELYQTIKNASEKIVSVKDDAIAEGSTEYKMLSSFYDLVKDGNTTIFTTRVREKYKEKYGDQYIPSITSFGRKLSDLGLMEYKKHSRDGNCYEISKEVFEAIISPIMPNILEGKTIQTIHNNSQQEGNNTNNDIICEEYVNDCEEKSVKGLKGLKGVKGLNTYQGFLEWDKRCEVWQQCAYPISANDMCGESPCNELDGLYFCKEHFEKAQKTNGGNKNE